MRDRLIELLSYFADGYVAENRHIAFDTKVCDIADHLIANGVTVQECGHWIEKPSGAYGRWQSWCSSCGKHSGIGGIESNRHKPYCPNCGAKMMPQPPKGE